MPFEKNHPTLVDYLHANARHYASRTAIYAPEGNVSWLELADKARRIAGWFIVQGFKPGDRIGFLTTTGSTFVIGLLGAWTAGLCVVPLSSAIARDTLVRLARDASLAGMVVSETYAKLALDIAQELGLPCGRCLCDAEQCGGFGSFDRVSNETMACTSIELATPEQESNIIYSSGTTGIPKGIVHTHAMRLNRALTWSLSYDLRWQSVMLLSTPASSNATWVNLIGALVAGGTVALLAKFTPQAFLEAAGKWGVTHAFLVPTQVGAVLGDAALPKGGLGDGFNLIVGGSKVPLDLKQSIEANITSRLYEIYGMTEGVATALSPSDLPGKLASVGRPSLGTEIVAIDGDGKPLPAGETGELVGRSPFFMTGYLHRPDADAEMQWRDDEGRLFMRTGDIGMIDADGYVYVLDRLKDMIVSGGQNIYASDIEDVVRAYPGVAEVAVIAAPHPHWGETPVAIVRLDETASADPSDIRDWANSRLSKFQRLNEVRLRAAAFPRNHLEKILKRQLREEFLASAV